MSSNSQVPSAISKFEFPQAKSIVVSGDIHGDFSQLVYKCCVQYSMKDTLIIVAGDCGFGFYKFGSYEYVYQKCRDKLSKANNWLVFVRGNHDNPAYYEEDVVKHKRWMTIPDYSVIKACGHSILCVGGATSIDRLYRIMSENWHPLETDVPLAPNVYWPNEQPYYDELKLDAIDEKFAIDTVITHTSPSFCELSSHHGLYEWAIRDEDLIDDVKHERKVMDNLHAYLYAKNHPLRYWFYGHFHQSWHSEIEGVQYNMLDIMEIREISNDDEDKNP